MSAQNEPTIDDFTQATFTLLLMYAALSDMNLLLFTLEGCKKMAEETKNFGAVMAFNDIEQTLQAIKETLKGD